MDLRVLTAEEVQEVLREAEMEMLANFVQKLWRSAHIACPGVSGETEMVKAITSRLKVGFFRTHSPLVPRT